MRAVQVDEAHQVGVVEVPEPVGAELVMEVRAAGVGFPDLLMSRGEFQHRQEPPFTLGWEASGIISHAEPNAGFRVGDRVVSMALGAYAEKVSASSAVTFRLPEELSFAEGAAYPHNYLTAYAGLIRRGRLQAGERVLVHGAGGGVGSAAVQLAKAAGAEVFAVVSSERKAAISREAGADHVLEADQDWRSRALELSGGGVNVVFDPVGGDRFKDSLRVLASEGRLVVVGFAAGEIPQVGVNRLLFKNVDVCGCTWSVLAETPRGVHAASLDLNRWVADGAIRPIVGQSYPVESISLALARIEERTSLGKTIVTI